MRPFVISCVVLAFVIACLLERGVAASVPARQSFPLRAIRPHMLQMQYGSSENMVFKVRARVAVATQSRTTSGQSAEI